MTSLCLAGYVCWVSGRVLLGKDPWRTHAGLFSVALVLALSSVLLFLVIWSL